MCINFIDYILIIYNICIYMIYNVEYLAIYLIYVILYIMLHNIYVVNIWEK